jgi:hypothetical protein
MKKLQTYIPLLRVLFAVFICCTFVLTHNVQNAFAQQTPSFTFGAAGDYSSTSNTDAVLTAVRNAGVNFQLAVGDLSYDTQGSPAGWATYVKNIIGTIPFIIVEGNHDASKIDKFVSALPNQMSTTQGTYGKQYYFDYPATSPLARFIFMSPVDGTKDLAWFNTTVDAARANNIKWIIVSIHQPCVTTGVKSCEIGQDTMNALTTKKVDVVLSGHEHNYQRSKQLTCAQANTTTASCIAASGSTFTKEAGTVLVIVGTGGNSLYTVNANDSEAGYFEKINGTSYGFAKFTVSATQLQEQYVQAAGNAFSDSFTINVSQSTTPQPSTIQPTYQCLGGVPCAPSLTPTGSATQPSTPAGTTAPSPTVNPCVGIASASYNGATEIADHHKKHHRKFKKSNDSYHGLFEQLLRLIEQLLRWLSGNGSLPDINPSPTPSTAPNPTTNPCPSPTISEGTPTINPSVTPTNTPTGTTPVPTGSTPTPTTKNGTTKNVEITFYGAYDNDPAGSTDISDPVIHQKAGGTGTYADPLTFASPEGTGEYAVGQIIYVPLVQKYFIREDVCALSWTAPNGCGAVSHVDLYVGNPSTSQSVIRCEESLTPSGNAQIILNPPSNLIVDAKPIWNQSTGTCMSPHQ